MNVIVQVSFGAKEGPFNVQLPADNDCVSCSTTFVYFVCACTCVRTCVYTVSEGPMGLEVPTPLCLLCVYVYGHGRESKC